MTPLRREDGYVLFVGADVALRERSLAGAIRAAGGRAVYTVTPTRNSPGLKYFDGFIVADIADDQKILEGVRRIEAETGQLPVAVVPTNDFTVTSSAAVADALRLPRNSQDTVDACRDKKLMKDLLAQKGIPVPHYRTFTTREELVDAAGSLEYPLVIKPRQMAGSLGVLKIDDADQLDAAYQTCVDAVASLHGLARAAEDLFQVEEYIEYPDEVSVEVANFPDGVRRVLAVTDKLTGAEPYFVEVGHVVPSRHSGRAQLVELAIRSCEVLGIDYGVAHFEAKINAEGDVSVIEVAARTGGDAIMDLVEEVYGVNPYELHVLSYLGVTPDAAAFDLDARGRAAIGFLKPGVGTIEKVDLAAPALNAPDVTYFSIGARVGDEVKPLTSWREREGHIRYWWPLDDDTDTGAQLRQRTQSVADAVFAIRSE